MSLTFLIILVLTAAITFFVVSISLILIVHKNTSRGRMKAMKALKDHYAEVATKFLMMDIPAPSHGEPQSAQFRQYEKILQPLRRRFSRLSKGRRERHRFALKEVLLDFAKDLSGEAGDRLVFIGYSLGFVDDLIRQLQSGRWWLRAHAARDLGFLGAKRAIPPLTAAVEDPNAEVRFQAIQALIVLVGVDALRIVFRVGRNLSTWNMMALSVIVLRFKEDAISYLLEGLEAKDQSIVVFCIEMLAEIGFVTAVEPLRSVAKEYPNIVVRTKAVEALGRLGDSRAVALLIDNTTNSYPEMRMSALGALQRVGAVEAIPALVRRLKDGPLHEKIEAGRAILAAGPEGRTEMEQVVASGDTLLARVAEQVLEDEGRGGAQ